MLSARGAYPLTTDPWLMFWYSRDVDVDPLTRAWEGALAGWKLQMGGGGCVLKSRVGYLESERNERANWRYRMHEMNGGRHDIFEVYRCVRSGASSRFSPSANQYKLVGVFEHIRWDAGLLQQFRLSVP